MWLNHHRSVMNSTEGITNAPVTLQIPDRAHLHSLGGVKWSRHGPDVIPAWVADMDIRSPDCVMDAVVGLFTRGDLGYNNGAVDQLGEAFASWQKQSHGWDLDAEKVRGFCDVLHAVDTILHLHTEPGDGVVVFTPVYPPFLKALEGNHCRLVGVGLERPDWRLDPERLEAAIDSSTKAILMCNPHNPTGRTFDEQELNGVIEVAAKHNLLVISDEVWGDLVHPEGMHRPLSSLGEKAESLTITLSSTSKSFNTAGLRCAVAHLGHQEMKEKIEGLPSHLLGAISTPGAEATLAAWTHGRPWLDAVRAHLVARRDQLKCRLEQELPEVRFDVPQATYLAWLDFSATGLGDDPAAAILGTGKLALSPGPDFSTGGTRHARVNFATSEQVLDEIIDRLVGSVRELMS